MTADEQNERGAEHGTEPGAEPATGQVPGQAGAPSRESLTDSPDRADTPPSGPSGPTGTSAPSGPPISGRVPGQAVAGQGGVTPEAFVAHLGEASGPHGDLDDDPEFETPLGLVPPPPTRWTASARPPTPS